MRARIFAVARVFPTLSVGGPEALPLRPRRHWLGAPRPLHEVEIICIVCHNVKVRWAVEIADEFEPEFDALHEDVQTEILALALLLEQFGPQ